MMSSIHQTTELALQNSLQIMTINGIKVCSQPDSHTQVGEQTIEETINNTNEQTHTQASKQANQENDVTILFYSEAEAEKLVSVIRV
jgi:muramoyltetrapeptide carboxypeptidase LdcA involved in peptidoglycan recycling